MSTPHPGGGGPSHGQWVPPPAHVRKGRRKWPWVLLAVVLLLAGGCAALVIGLDKETDKTVRVRYEVTGSAKGVAVAYTTWQGGALVTQKEGPRDLPWRKELVTKDFVKGGLLAVTTGKGGGTVACSVTVNDGRPRTATASGPDATATCTGF
ncbi:hypothetical protein AB0G83_31820 [Streptomyces klenkii]|uniref:hypothetical protein n=1 Tax=Streptomyces TaxID=1883 RepID=UPI001E478559|nr:MULTISPECIES: hypothetical protein [Streptomyces]